MKTPKSKPVWEWLARWGRHRLPEPTLEPIPPIDQLRQLTDARSFIAGGAETRSAVAVGNGSTDGAVFSNQGRRYAPYNEDAGILFVDSRQNMYAAVFDQAGGLGGHIRGQASQLAATIVSKCFKHLAMDEVPPPEWGSEIEQALHDAHQQLINRNEGEVTTAVVAALHSSGAATLVSSGDSAAIHFGSDGGFVDMTSMHLGRGSQGTTWLAHALGLVPEGPSVEAQSWQLDPGDLILLCTDGLLDAGVPNNQLGQWLVESDSVETAVNGTAKRVLRRMNQFQAKPDNLTLVAMRRRNHDP